MKKIIRGRVYDTNTARQMATAYPGNNYNPRDFNYCHEALYRKQTGEFFIHGEGGPMSKYAQPTGQNQWTGGEGITPLTYDQAQEWAEKYLTGDEYEQIFGIVEEPDENARPEPKARRAVGLNLSEYAIRRIADLAAQWDCTKSEVVERLLEK